jgi:hypothetical protein
MFNGIEKENTDMMEALLGAVMNMKLADVAYGVYKQAETKGDTSTMERAMGYVGEFQRKANEYVKEAKEESVEISEEARKMYENKESATSESADKPAPVKNNESSQSISIIV